MQPTHVWHSRRKLCPFRKIGAEGTQFMGRRAASVNLKCPHFARLQAVRSVFNFREALFSDFIGFVFVGLQASFALGDSESL